MKDQNARERTCVIGIGNEYRNDDGVGLLIAGKIRERRIPDVTVLGLSGEGGGLMSAWNGADTVILIDAVSSGAQCGSTYRIDARSQTIPSDFFHYSTHAFSVAESIELAKVIGKLPEHCILFGIEGKDFGMGMRVSREVQDAADRVVALVLNEIDCVRSHRMPVL